MTYVKINSEKKIVKIIYFRKVTYKNRNTYTVCEESLKCIKKITLEHRSAVFKILHITIQIDALHVTNMNCDKIM